jgi:hypothetical protein
MILSLHAVTAKYVIGHPNRHFTAGSCGAQPLHTTGHWPHCHRLPQVSPTKIVRRALRNASPVEPFLVLRVQGDVERSFIIVLREAALLLDKACRMHDSVQVFFYCLIEEGPVLFDSEVF